MQRYKNNAMTCGSADKSVADDHVGTFHSNIKNQKQESSWDRPARKADNLTAICEPIVRKCESLDVS
jgi:hypothetical protein